MEKDMVDIFISYRGEDFKICVDLETANTLLNDQQLAEQYIQAAFFNNSDATEGSTSNEPLEDGSQENCDEVGESQSTSKKKVCNSRGRPTADDEEATKLFLELRQKYNDKFNDKKTVKSVIWKEIAKKMGEAGYDLCAQAKEGPGGKCKQKFQNMERTYIQHVKLLKSTGEGKKDPPPYFDELHSILGEKDKVDPKNLQDSENVQPSTSSENDNTDTVSNTEIKNRFAKVKKSIKPQHSVDVLKELKKEHEDRADQFNKLYSVLQEQNNQRNQMLDLLKEFVNSKKRKRDDNEQ